MDKPLAISMGEPAGIGPDLILQLYENRAKNELPPFCLFGNAEFLQARAKRLGLGLNIASTSVAEAGKTFADALPVVSIAGLISDSPGKASALTGKVVIGAIEQAVAAVQTGTCRALVTAPIHKAALYHAGFKHPGHTEFLAYLCAKGSKERRPVMMLAHNDLRVIPVTIHTPIKDVPSQLTRASIVETVTAAHYDLRLRFGIGQPRIAVAGLNPHAGESGNIGSEETDIIGPAIDQLRYAGINVEGPFPADTLFYPRHWRRYDVIIAMYHDQALIPIKTVAFEEAVNVTLGLPIVRTSPDHGTAFELAGTGRGSTRSLLAAIRMADELTRGRD
ncbi:4-hydroxythreonine-4-phosphate dehydrogenase PdxA [Devosia algicola]|uniref:4-hydroxythreonine-4-phosphate dehydrogenase n=1 Tax=Devosia algicola TaxID=3026418 RepID=A0ABY7YRS1_9HYPH|nr:4-hydroxythreonine-4-phosphate dehydrogenase PdxA [Devosia algicola]WDR03585.1 4-hydroxythreonine-4-phosphate dehydrogenase PdxA [Devosia algicola]